RRRERCLRERGTRARGTRGVRAGAHDSTTTQNRRSYAGLDNGRPSRSGWRSCGWTPTKREFNRGLEALDHTSLRPADDPGARATRELLAKRGVAQDLVEGYAQCCRVTLRHDQACLSVSHQPARGGADRIGRYHRRALVEGLVDHKPPRLSEGGGG